MFAFCIFSFVSSHGIVIGGISGLGLAVERGFHIPAEWFVLPVNIVILILGWIVLGKKMVVTSIASSILFPLFFSMLRYVPYVNDMTQNILLASIIAGAGVGASVGLLMRVGASTGGTDIICLSLHKWFRYPISYFVLVTDFTIIFSQVFVSGIEMVLYGLIYTAVETTVLNKVMVIGQSQMQIMVISDHYEQIRTCILTELRAGVTMINIQTGCRGEDQLGVLCVVQPRKLYGIQKKILSIDQGAFITVNQIKEVRGQGFTLERRDMIPASQILVNTSEVRE